MKSSKLSIQNNYWKKSDNGYTKKNIFYTKKKELCPAYASEINSNNEKQVAIPNKGKEGWHYLTIKTVHIIKGIISKHHGDFYCLNCLHSFTTGNTLKSNEKDCNNKIFVEL